MFEEVRRYYARHQVSGDLIELRNLFVVAGLIVHSALARRESRGLHQVQDYPETREDLRGKNTILIPRRGQAIAVKDVKMGSLRRQGLQKANS